MSYKIIKNLWINKEQLIVNDINDQVTIEKDGYSFVGTPILVRNERALVIEGDGMDYAVLLDIDSWSTKNNYNVVVFRDENWELEEFINTVENELYGADEIVAHLTAYYKSLQSKFKECSVEKSSSPAAPNTSSFRSIISGDIKVLEKYTHYSENNSRTYIPVGLQIGSGIDPETIMLIKALAKTATAFATNKISNGSALVSNGTNFKTIALSVY